MDTKSALGHLIDDTRAPDSVSYDGLARKATAAGHKMSKSNVSRLAKQQPLVSISATAIKGLAAALGVSERRIAVAAVQSMGVSLEIQLPTVVEAIHDEVRFSDETKRILLGVVASTLDSGKSLGSARDLPDSSSASGEGKIRSVVRADGIIPGEQKLPAKSPRTRR